MDKLKVLFLGSRPREAPPLRLKEQVQETIFRLGESGLQSRIDLKTELTVSFTDLPNLLMDRTPAVVHFTGHSSDEKMLALEDKVGSLFLVEPQAFIDMFKIKALRRFVRCVVLNTCYSDQTAQELSQYVDFVIGTHDEITQDAAIAFAQAFYPMLARGESVQDAFDMARAQFRGYAETKDAPLPTLMVRDGADAQLPLFHAPPYDPPPRPPVPPPPQPTNVFIVHMSTVSEDRSLYVELSVQLRALQGRIKCWDKTQLKGGDQVEKVTKQHFQAAQIILLLVSPDAVADDEWQAQANLAMHRHHEGTAQVIPIMLRPSFIDGAKFATLSFLPGNDRAMSGIKDRPKAWMKVLADILDASRKL